MLGLIYPECPTAPQQQSSLLNDKEMVIYQNLYSHFCINKHLPPQQANIYAMMYTLKQKYHSLSYPSQAEQQLANLLAGK